MSNFANITRGQDEEIAKRLGGEAGIAQFLAGETVVVPKNYQVSGEGMANGGVTYASAIDPQAFLADQRQYFREVFSKPLPRVKLPQTRPGFSWGFIMASFMSPQWLWDCARERKGVGAWKYNNAESLDTLVEHNDRDPKKDGAYAGFCRDRVEADEEHKGKSRDQIIVAAIKGMTLAEYENLFIWFHWKTGKFLDRNNWTLCTGSLDRDGDVPDGSSYDDKLFVHWDYRFHASSYLRTREVVLVP